MSADLAIIVPVFNEQDNVLPMVEQVGKAFANSKSSFELVFVDDGSSDETWNRIQEGCRRERWVRGLRHKNNAGQSAAFWTGLQNTRSPLVATLDGDLQNDPADLPRLMTELAGADFVCGVRAKRQDTWVRKVSSRIARRTCALVLGAKTRDNGCFLRVFRRSALDGLFPFNGWHRMLPMLVQGAGVKIKEVDVNHRPRVAGVSKYGISNRLWRGIFDLIGVSWYQKRRLRVVSISEQATPR